MRRNALPVPSYMPRLLLHKRRNGAEHLPKNAQGDYDRRIGNAYARTD